MVTATAVAVQRMVYDAWGRVLEDTDKGWRVTTHKDQDRIRKGIEYYKNNCHERSICEFSNTPLGQ